MSIAAYTNHPYIESNKQRFLDELFDLLRIPTISAQPQHAGDCRKAAEWIAAQLHAAGADNVELCETPGNPIVYGDKIVDPSLPTVLVYGHYDVQPADPLELWHIAPNPFEPVVKDEKIYARGACDDKGQMYMHLKAFETLMQNGGVPCNVKFMLEGEEEVGSANLDAFVANNKAKLKADIILISDTGMLSNEHPSICVGLRGLAYMHVKVTGPNRDLHSGMYGGAVANPINILAKMIASLHDDNNRITIPGFYDGVEEVNATDRAAMGKAPFSEEEFKRELAIEEVWGEAGYTTLERKSIRPTLDCNGIIGGYTGEGSKTVLPSIAKAQISMRLVPGQNPHTISDLFTAHIKAIAPPYVKVEVASHHGGFPAVTPTDSPAYKAAAAAFVEAWGKEPIPMREGGSIPIVALFERELGIKTVLLGFGLDTDNIHSPDENYGLFNYFKGIETITYFYKHFAQQAKA